MASTLTRGTLGTFNPAAATCSRITSLTLPEGDDEIALGLESR